LGIEIVYDANAEAIVHKGVYEMRANKTRSTDDDNVHRMLSESHAPASNSLSATFQSEFLFWLTT
jgi:hypothetical protein